VIVTLGIRENPLRVRLLGPTRTPLAVRSAGTRNIIAAMKEHGVRKLVVQTSYGVGETRARLGLGEKLFVDWILKPQIADAEQQERDVLGSGLDWVIVQPVHLTDDADDGMPFVSMTGDTHKLKVSRSSVGRFLALGRDARVRAQVGRDLRPSVSARRCRRRRGHSQVPNVVATPMVMSQSSPRVVATPSGECTARTNGPPPA
jgi:hypothetical protein